MRTVSLYSQPIRLERGLGLDDVLLEAIGHLIRPSQKLLSQLIDRGTQLGWGETCVVARQLLQPDLNLLGAGGGGDGLAKFSQFGG